MTRRSKIALLILAATVALMGYYAVRLKRRAERLPARAVEVKPAPPPPPVTGKPNSVTLYVADDRDGLLHKRTVDVTLPAEASERGLQVLRALIAAYQETNSAHPLAPDADVEAVFWAKPNIAVVDTNAAFADGHRSGILVEQLTVASVAQTLAANLPNVGRVRILVQGKERQTLAGHADLSSFYDLSTEPWPIAP